MNYDLLLGAAITGTLALGVELVKHRLPSREKQIDDAAALRKELRDENTALKAENKVLKDNYEAAILTIRDLSRNYEGHANTSPTTKLENHPDGG